MSHKPAPVNVFDELNGKLTDSAKATLIRIARKLADGYEGDVKITVGKGGGIRQVEWLQREDGSTIREMLG